MTTPDFAVALLLTEAWLTPYADIMRSQHVSLVLPHKRRKFRQRHFSGPPAVVELPLALLQALLP